MYEDCPVDCLFLHEAGCTDCRECTYCGKYLHWSGTRSRLNFEHIKAWIKGGRTVVPTCEKCNKSKQSKSLKTWLRWVECNNTSLWNKIVDYS